MANEPIVTLTCSLCGKKTQGRQYSEMTKGQGLCSRCYHFLKSTGGTEEALKKVYGGRGYHFKIGENYGKN